MITSKECLKEIKKAIKQFGEYSYEDKGPGEVMDMSAIESKMEDMTAQQIAALLVDIKDREYGEEFVRDVLVDLQSRQDLDALYEDPRLEGLY